MTKKHLSKEEKMEIRRLLKDWKKHTEIGLFLDRPQPTISKEIDRNSVDGIYHPLRAQRLYEQRRVQANVNNTKLLRNHELRAKIVSKLSSKDEDWSPDTIAWRLKKERQDYVCGSTIYDYIYNHEPWLRKFLRYKKRYKKRWTKELRMIWNNIKNISSRAPIIEKRKRIWDWELDTIVSVGRIWRWFTAFDRKSRLVKLRKLTDWKAHWVYEAIMESLSWETVLSLTSDNGKEFADRELVEANLQTPFYFANPYHSWERGTNENGNRCIRKFLPKKFDFSNVPEDYFLKIEHMLNNKPRKILNYRTPFEVHYAKKNRLFS